MTLIRRGMGGPRGLAVLCLAATAGASGCAPSQQGLAEAAPAVAATLPAVLEIHDERLLPVVALLVDRSPHFSSALAALSDDAALIHVHSYRTAPHGPSTKRRYSYGYTLAFVDPRGGIDSVHVAVDLGQALRDAGALGLPGPDLLVELAVLLGHELFGHAIPLVAWGTAAGECPDEARGRASCSVERENLIRADLGVRPRAGYPLIGLHVTRFRDQGVISAGRGTIDRE